MQVLPTCPSASCSLPFFNKRTSSVGYPLGCEHNSCDGCWARLWQIMSRINMDLLHIEDEKDEDAEKQA
jgi:hypothetical protein